MKYFPVLRTRRLAIQLKELSIGNALALANIPEHLEEQACTAFLGYVTDSVKSGPDNPSMWTVQERTLVVSHYLAAVVDDGPNFSLGEGNYFDYLDGEADISVTLKKVSVGEVGGDQWAIQQLTGAMAEAIERSVGEVPNLSPRLHWIVGAMAAQLIRANEDAGDLVEGGYDEWLLNRMTVFMSFPESDFEQLMLAYSTAKEKLYHLFNYDFNDRGLVILPKKGGAVDLPTARFQVRAGLSRLALDMAGKPD